MAFCNNISDLIDFLVFTFVNAPDKFPKEHNMTLKRAFNEIELGFNTIKEAKQESTKAHIQEIKQFIDQAYEAYKQGDIRKGCFLMQDAELALRDLKKRKHIKI